jgi:hypothetical protein
MGKKRKAYSVLVEKPETKSHVKVFSTDRRIMLKQTLNKSSRVLWTGLIWPRVGTNDRLLGTWL